MASIDSTYEFFYFNLIFNFFSFHNNLQLHINICIQSKGIFLPKGSKTSAQQTDALSKSALNVTSATK